MSESEATSTSSPLNHFPPEQRGSLEFQKELNDISGTTRYPLDLKAAMSEEAARNVEKIEEVMRSSSSSLHLYMDTAWYSEEYYRGGPSDNWKSKEPSNLGGGFLDIMYNRNPRLISKEEAEEMISKIAAEWALTSRARDASSAEEPISLISLPSDSLGEAYYDLEAGSAHDEGGATNDDDDVMDIYGAVPEYFEEVEDITEEDVEEVIRDIDLCNYDYVPDDSDIETYEATPQPELEDVVMINGSPRILACRDQPTTLTEEGLAELVEQFRLEGSIVLPGTHMRCYRFNHPENNGRIPRMVMSANSLRVGVASPLHPFIQDVFEAYHLDPIQINPNSYRSMIVLYIIYYKQDFPFLDANNLGYFLQLKKLSKKDFGYVYLAVWPEFDGKNLIFGTPSNAGSWKEPFFYIHDVPRVKTSFNYYPGSEASPLLSFL